MGQTGKKTGRAKAPASHAAAGQKSSETDPEAPGVSYEVKLVRRRRLGVSGIFWRARLWPKGVHSPHDTSACPGWGTTPNPPVVAAASGRARRLRAAMGRIVRAAARRGISFSCEGLWPDHACGGRGQCRHGCRHFSPVHRRLNCSMRIASFRRNSRVAAVLPTLASCTIWRRRRTGTGAPATAHMKHFLSSCQAVWRSS